MAPDKKGQTIGLYNHVEQRNSPRGGVQSPLGEFLKESSLCFLITMTD